MKIAIFGFGYVGLTSAVCLAELGHRIVGVEVSASKVDLVNRGESPIFEPGVPERLASQVADGLVTATTDATAALNDADAAFVAVGTPSTIHGAIDDSHLIEVVTQIAQVRHEL